MKIFGLFAKTLFVFGFLVWVCGGSAPQHLPQEDFGYFTVKTTDNLTISVARYSGVGHHQASVRKMIVLPGKTCNDAWKKFISLKFAALGFDVFVLDFRGMGRSQRLVSNPQMVHVGDFKDYLLDLEALVASNVIEGMPVHIYGHSMGGLVALLALQKNTIKCSAAVLEAPMTGINTAPVPHFLAEPLAWFMVRVLKKSKDYCVTQSDYKPPKNVFLDNKCSHSKEYYEQYIHLKESDKTMVPRGTSWGWILASLRAIREFLGNLKSQGNLKTKVFIGSAGDDKIVDNAHDAKIAEAYHGVHHTYKGAWHSLQHDCESTRVAFFKDVEDFLKDAF